MDPQQGSWVWRGGRPLPLLDRIDGRTTDFLVAPDGTAVHALSVIYILREIAGIERFRVRQRTPTDICVQMVVNARYDRASEASIRSGLEQRLEGRLNVAVEYMADLPPEPSGKFRYVVSECSAPNHAATLLV